MMLRDESKMRHARVRSPQYGINGHNQTQTWAATNHPRLISDHGIDRLSR